MGNGLPAGQSDEHYIAAFLNVFGASMEKPAAFIDKTGDPLMMSSDLFLNRATGGWKVQKRGREAYLPMLADSIIDPDEIWVAMEWHGVTRRVVVRRRYIASWSVGEGGQGIAVFEYGTDGWCGVSTFQVDVIGPERRAEYIGRIRQGVRLWRRHEG